MFVHQVKHFTVSNIGAMEGLDRFNYIIKLHKKRKNPIMRNLVCPLNPNSMGSHYSISLLSESSRYPFLFLPSFVEYNLVAALCCALVLIAIKRPEAN